ncbi:nucleotidyltransferase family protein [Candidatus Berkelbacteria bacterium]|nr:nucleotidyltransferase family protein [Candidatus Berkelbacteria bacterium]
MSKHELHELKRKIQPIVVRFPVRHVDVVGSVARGEDTPASDLDLVVDFKPGATLFDLVGLQQELEGEFRKKVDVMTEDSIHPRLKDAILKDRVALL